MSIEGFRIPGAYTTRVTFHSDASASAAWTNMPSAVAFIFTEQGATQFLSVSGMYRLRLLVNKRGTAGATGSKLMVRYSSTYSVTASDYIDLGTSEVSVAINVANTFLDSGWVAISPAAIDIGDIYVAIIGSGGDGVLDPAFGSIAVEFQ